MRQSRARDGEAWRFPPLGQRILKTTVAVFLCLLVYCLFGYRGQDMPAEAAITAIICMQPYVRDSRDYALNRFTGTLIGAAWGLLLLLLLLVFPVLGSRLLILYGLMALGVMVSLYTTVLFHKPDTSSLAAIVFICLVISFPDIDDPLRQALTRFLGVLLGTAAAIGVNVFRLPRDKNPNQVFFLRTKDFVPDRFSPIPSSALFQLNYLSGDGARICLMSEHAPAFFMMQMGTARLNVPLIVMDGAAIFDANENRYLWIEALPVEESAWLRAYLDSQGLSYFTYTVHRNKTCIFHQGPVNEQEQVILQRMRRSPYRDYLEGESYAPEEIVYCKLIAGADRVEEIEKRLRAFLSGHRLRLVERVEAGAPGIWGLYIYSEKATLAAAQERLMAMLREHEPELQPVEIFSRTPYRSERDAMHLLHTLGSLYEPVKGFHRRR